MLRYAARKIPHLPIVTLDFLLPRFYATKSSGRYADAEYLYTHHTPSGRPRMTLSQAILAPSGLSLQPLPKADEAWLSQELLGSLSAKQCQIYNEVTHALQSALRRGDLHEARKSWKQLADHQLLPFLGSPHYETYSHLLAKIVADDTRMPTLSQVDETALEEMMLVVAAGGHVDGLREYMLWRIRKGDASRVLELYPLYVEKLQERTRRGAGTEGSSSSHKSEDSEEQEEDFLYEDDPKPVEDVEVSGRTPEVPHIAPTRTISGEILLCVIAAHAMKNNFMDALHTSLKAMNTPVRILLKSMADFQSIPPDLCLKTNKYVRRILLAKSLYFNAKFAMRVQRFAQERKEKTLERTYDDITSVLDEPDSWIALTPSEVSRHKPVLLPNFAWAAFLRAFMRCKQLDRAEKIWDDMAKYKVEPIPDVWVALLEGYAELRMVEQARTAWSTIQERGITRTPMMWRAIITAEFRAGNPEEALQKFQQFLTETRVTDPSTVLLVHNTVLLWMLHNSREEEALALVKRMQEHGPQPDVVTFNTMMRYYAKTGNLRSLATTIQDMNKAKVIGDIYTYSIVLTALAPVRKDAVQIVLNLMRQHSIEPNVAVYTSIIQYLMRQGTEAGFKAAFDLLNWMETDSSVDIRPNEITYTAILTSIHRRNWLKPNVMKETTQLIWEKMAEQHLPSSSTTYNVLIKACLANPAPEGLANALRYYREMSERRIPIVRDTGYILLTGLLHRKEWALANQVVDEIPDELKEQLRTIITKARVEYRKYQPLDAWSI